MEYRWATLIAKAVQAERDKEALAEMLGLPQDWPPP
jgi:hypothetical protein